MNPYLQTYRQNAVTTAPPKAILVRLHDKMIADMQAAEAAWQNDNLPEMRSHVEKVQDIISFLRGRLDLTVEASHPLVQLYNYYLVQLARLFIHPEQSLFKELGEYLRSWRETWAAA